MPRDAARSAGPRLIPCIRGDADAIAAPGQELAPPAIPPPLDIVASGQQPAALLPPVQPNAPLDPVQQFVVENFNSLPELNLGAFEAQDLSTVVFNASLLTQEQLAQADREGTLAALLQASTPMGASPPPAPAAQGAAAIAADAAAARPQMQVQTAPEVPAMPAPKVPAGTQNMLARTRVRNMGAGPKAPGLTPNPLAGAVAGRPV